MRPAGLSLRTVCRASRVLLVLFLICFTVTASPVERRQSPEVTKGKGSRQRLPKTRRQGKGSVDEDSAAPQGQAEIVRLLDAFGLKAVPKPNRTAATAPPAFMMNLYHQLEASVGSARRTADAPSKPRANTVRAFNEKGTMSSRNKYLFDTSSILSRETVLAAELHLYKQKPRRSSGWTDSAATQLVTCELYELRERANTILDDPPGLSRTLMDRKVVDASSRGWIHFNVTSAFRRYTAAGGHLVSDRLFEIRIKSEHELPKGAVVFSKRPQAKHRDRRPLLVLFLDDRNVLASDISLPGTEIPTPQDSASGLRIKQTSSDAQRSEEEDDVANEEEEDEEEEEEWDEETGLESGIERSDRRKRRASSRTGNRGKDKCKLYDYYVDFNVIGWSNWVIAPNGYTANFCEGDCPFPLDLNFNATNHATVQAILHMHTGTFRNNRRLPNPCCVPATLDSIHVLYLDDLNNVVLKEFSDMIATSCGCQ